MLSADKILLRSPTSSAVPIYVLSAAEHSRTLKDHPVAVQSWIKANGFSAAPMSFVCLPDKHGKLGAVLVGQPKLNADPFTLGKLASLLPAGTYLFASALADPTSVALGWCLELYRYDPFRPITPNLAKLVCPTSCDREATLSAINATYQVRDLVNAPANLMGPDELEAAALALAKLHKAKAKVVVGKVLATDFPLIHHVGKASPRAPRLIDFSWGPLKAPKVTIVGKGVCFDTGGLDIKPSSGMLLMKKDMGGAANVLGLARLIMEAKLPVRLRVLIPAVENSISGEAFRPGDVFKTRKGLTVEIGNTDAEGRLVLCEALALADEEAPDLLIDMATLTGAARVALGPDLPPFYTDDDTLAAELAKAAQTRNDPLWRLPLWSAYDSLFDSPIANMNNSSTSGFAGSITAALFLKRFVERAKSYVHFDIFAWTPSAKAGRPRGGEAQGIRALFAVIKERYGQVH